MEFDFGNPFAMEDFGGGDMLPDDAREILFPPGTIAKRGTPYPMRVPKKLIDLEFLEAFGAGDLLTEPSLRGKCSDLEQ